MISSPKHHSWDESLSADCENGEHFCRASESRKKIISCVIQVILCLWNVILYAIFVLPCGASAVRLFIKLIYENVYDMNGLKYVSKGFICIYRILMIFTYATSKYCAGC